MPEIRALTIFTSVAADRCPTSSSKIFLNVGIAWMWFIEIGMVQIVGGQVAGRDGHAGADWGQAGGGTVQAGDGVVERADSRSVGGSGPARTGELGDRVFRPGRAAPVVRCSLRTPTTCGLPTNSWRR
jgi:hypothetical protein